jgi:HAD superfamily hydrolase (TIGR01662 family)
MSARATYDVVVPTVGRASLGALLAALAAQNDLERCGPERVLLVDDRPEGMRAGLLVSTASKPARIDLLRRVGVLRSWGRGPAAARNVGWRAAGSAWVAFLDDDVVPPADWCERLVADLRAAGPRAAGVQGRIVVPLPTDRRPTDWERNVAGLERAQWATADLAYRRAALAEVGGFDERFTRNYREDADLGLRLQDAGWEIRRGERTIAHPVGPGGPWTSVRAQRGNADDALMRKLHGKGWRERAGAPPGRLPRHAATAAAGALSLAAMTFRARRSAAAAGAAWAAGTVELARARISHGPKTPKEIATMAATSALIPFVASWHRMRGPKRPSGAPPTPPAAVLFDRDGTLIVDVPYNGDPDRVEPLPGAREALALLRGAEIPVGVVSNQSGIGRGLIHEHRVDAVNARVEQLLGPLWPVVVCPHAPAEHCDCRKPRPGLILEAARRLGVRPERCAVIGDIGADVEAARAAGARAILVPTPLTRREEVEAAAEVAPDLPTAVRMLLGGAAAEPSGSETADDVRGAGSGEGEGVLRRRRPTPKTEGRTTQQQRRGATGVAA